MPGGFVVYSGTASGVLSYFAKLGLHAPPHYNPADFMRTLSLHIPLGLCMTLPNSHSPLHGACSGGGDGQ
jgi:hypothetical protein